MRGPGWIGKFPAPGMAASAQMLRSEPPTPDSVQELRYLHAVVLESLRLRPPAYIVGRCAARPMRLGPHSLPAGAARVCLLPMYAWHPCRSENEEQGAAARLE